MNERILLVEDEPVTAITTQRMLEKHGYRVAAAPDGEGALAMFSAQLFDLVLMDIDLGEGMDGTETARRMLERQDVPLIFLSSHTEPEIVDRTEAISSYGYVVKNSGETVLLASIRMAFRLYRSRTLYQDTFDHSINGLCIHEMLYDAQGKPDDCRYVRVNAAFETHTGISRQMLLEKGTVKAIFPGEHVDGLIDMYAKVVQTKEPVRQDLWFEPTGHWYELSVFPMHDDLFTVAVQNINRLKEAEEQLRRSEADYRALFENHSAVKLLIDPQDGSIVDANQAAAAFYGWDREQLCSMRIQQINSLTPEQVAAEMERARSSRRTWFEFVHRLADGSVRDVDVFSNRVEISGRELLHSIVFDVSAYKSSERYSMKLLQQLIKYSPNLVAVLDYDFRIEQCSGTFARLLGVAPEEICGRNLLELLPGALQQKCRRFVAGCIADGGVQSDNIRIRERSFDATCFKIGSRKMERIGLIADDVTAREEAARELLVNRWVLESSLSAVAVADLEGRHLYVNPAFCRLWMIPDPADVVGVPVTEFWVGPEEALQVVEGIRRDGVWTGVLAARRKDGAVRSMQVAAGLIRDDAGQPVCMQASFIDVTEQKELHDSLNEQVRENRMLLRELQHRAKNSFMMLAGLIDMHLSTADSPGCQALLEGVYSRVQSIAVLYDLLYKTDAVSEVDLCSYLLKLISGVPLPSRITVEPELEPVTVSTKAALQLGLILNELMTNSAKYAYAGKDGGKIHIRLEKSGQGFELAVADNGPGLGCTLDALPENGTGLRLVQTMVRSLRGTLEVSDGPGAGFRIVVP